MGIVRPKADWIGLLKVVRDGGSSDALWARDVSEAMAGALSRPYQVGLVVVEHNAPLSTARTVINGFEPGIAALFEMDAQRVMELGGRESFRRYFHPPRVATTHLEIERDMPEEQSAPAREYRAAMGFADVMGIIGHPDPGLSMVLCAMMPEVTPLSPLDRQLLTRLGLHLETSLRLRRRPEVVVAELDAKGRVLHREESAPSERTLSNHVARVEQAQSREGGMDLWPALVAGKFSVVERGTGRGKRYLVVENSAASQVMRALGERETEVVAQASRGLPAKMIGYAMGLSSSTVANHLLEAAGKVGVATRLELVRIAAMLSRDPRAGFAETALTDAERDVLELLQLGLSNAEIAKIRSRSVRTIANQVAALLRKTGSPSRRGLFGA